MSSPQIVAFSVFSSTTGAPLTGQAGSMSFSTYKNELGSNLTAPSIVEIGGGGYYFLPTLTSGHGIYWTISTGAGATPTYLSGYIRAEDFNTDGIPALQSDVTIIKKIETGKWSVGTSGGDANHLLIYDIDNTTVLYRFALTDQNGSPTFTLPFTRTPI